MKLMGIGALALLSTSAFASSVWYNGDDDTGGGFVAVVGTNGFGADVVEYEDFTWNSASNAGTINGTMLGTAAFSQVYWEIRTGMDPNTNNMGSLVASGTANATNVFVSNWTLNTSFDIYKMTANIGSVALTNGGSYFLGIAAVSNSSSFIGGITTTSGANSVGSPVNNTNNFYNWAGSGMGGNGVNLSMGIGTAAVPEPASMAALGLGAMALLRRRKK